jgi:hypothetical protein
MARGWAFYLAADPGGCDAFIGLENGDAAGWSGLDAGCATGDKKADKGGRKLLFLLGKNCHLG